MLLKLNDIVKRSRKLLENNPTFQNGFVSNIIYSYASFSLHFLTLTYFKQSCPELDLEASLYFIIHSFVPSYWMGFRILCTICSLHS